MSTPTVPRTSCFFSRGPISSQKPTSLSRSTSAPLGLPCYVLPLPPSLNELVGILTTHNHSSWSPITIAHQRFPFNTGPAPSQSAHRPLTAAEDSRLNQSPQPFRDTSPAVAPSQGKAAVAHSSDSEDSTSSLSHSSSSQNSFEAPQYRPRDDSGLDREHWHIACPKRDILTSDTASGSTTLGPGSTA